MNDRKASDKNLEIAVACDIRLGELFKANDELHGKYIDIDMLALTSIMQYFNPEVSGSFVFIAVHDDALNKDKNDYTVEGMTHRDFRPWRKNPTTTVEVAIGGSPLSFPDDFEGFVRTFYDNPRHYSAMRSLPETEVITTRLLKRRQEKPTNQVEQVARISGVTKAEESIHKITVHELCHASESKTEQKHDHKELERFKYKVRGKYLTRATLAATAIIGTADYTDMSDAIGLAGGAISWALAAKMYKAGTPAYKEYRRAQRPSETKAYATEEFAHLFPQVISFQSK